MIILNLLGSCVTRDAFSNKDKFSIKNYFARTSFASLVSEPIKVDLDDISLNSNFQKKSVYQDLNKSILNTLIEEPSDYLIIDLIDERFNLVQINNSIITMSNELKGSGLLDKFNYVEINRFENNVFDLWKKSVDECFNAIFKVYDPSQVILHKTIWREKYLDKSGEIKSFSPSMINGIKKQNNLLISYYEYIESFITKINIIDMTDIDLLSSENHIWGLSPYHFEDKYYEIFNNKLNEIIELPTFDFYSTKMGSVNLIKEYDYKRSYLDLALSGNIEFTKGLQFDESGIPLIKIRDLGPQYYPVTISLYGLECISKFYNKKDKKYYQSFISVCDYLVKTQETNGCWYVNYDYHYGVKEAGVCKAPWVSALSQGWGISCLVRAFYLTNEAKYINSAINAFKPFMKDVEEGGVQRKIFNSYIMYQEYPTEKPTHILNGFMFSLLGIFDLYKATNYEYVKELFDLGVETLINTVSMYDQGNVSSYDLTHIVIPGNPSKFHYGYHLTHVKELSALNSFLKNDILSNVINRWLSYAQGNQSCHRLTINKLTFEINGGLNSYLLKNKENIISINYPMDEELEFAAYVNFEGKRILTKSYNLENNFKFSPSEDNYELIIYVRDKFDNVIYKTISLKVGTEDIKTFELIDIKESLREKTIISVDKGNLSLSIGQNEYLDRLRFAYYVKENGEIIYKGWYDSNPTFQFPMGNRSLGDCEIVVFVRDSDDNQINYSLAVSS
ncbi:DUF6270 domain-containing protein [Bacillus salipaludis]|uniref:DUF6270 domain-containing protein n=1 Tax=Bacillus salipaludis TaxID=2547811 RepID=A0AA90R4N1_9BACI|nr:DUF6270 domain-containing protein [Bacillus salipaludis]MDQ6600383.1 DUF6270 domain-containing protein [Bacillus salipaludis]